MKKRDIVLLILLFLLCVLIFTQFDNVFTGKAGGTIPGGGEGCTECVDGTPANSCVDGDSPWYCLSDGDDCNLVSACTLCDCPPEFAHCNEEGGIAGLGACESTTCGDELCEGDEDSETCCSDCGCDGDDSCIDDECIGDDCGNGVIDSEEDCDGTEFGGESCTSLGYDSGSLSCDGCILNDDNCRYDDSGDEESPTVEKNCASVNGICTDSCFGGYVYYNNANYDSKCESVYGEGLVCCIPDYTVADESQDSKESEKKESTSIVGVEKFIIDEEESGVQKSPAPITEYKGIEKIIMSPSYAMGGIWIAFILTSLVVGISFYLHKRIYKKK
jgi:hypothetical protein